jgi:hypothetical protein
MEKFSLYDLLGLLLPGVLFVYFCNVFNSLFGVLKFAITTTGWDVSTLILLCFALIAGAMLYAVNFLLIKQRWYNWLFGMKKHVADIYLDLAIPFQSMNLALNKKAIEWYGNLIFFSKEELARRKTQLTDHERNIQDDFYVRMYYELEYEDKIDSAKTLQSFYYFFRQTVTACLLLLVLFLILMTGYAIFGKLPRDMNQVLGIPILLILTVALSAWHAQWYRKSMVLKMYWAYFTHLNQNSNK